METRMQVLLQDWPAGEALATLTTVLAILLLAVVPEFGLRVFQSPSGNDVRALSARNG